MNKKLLSLSVAASLGIATAHAQENEPALEVIEVLAHPLSGEGLSQAVDVLEGEELERKMATSLGDTLANQPGVRSSSFGTAVGRPVIHGLGGPRVRIMEDRIDTLDVSVTSADHAVAVDPFIADRIEVLKGPSTLLYGSGAIGGVVDVHTGRIPHTLPNNRFSGGVETRFDGNSDGNATVLKLEGAAGSFGWHFDAAFKDGDIYEIPGFAESARLRALEEEEEGEGEEEAFGELPGSAFDTQSYAGGGSYIADWGFVGVAVSRLEADYGLPGGHGHEHEEDEEEHGDEEEAEGETPVLDLKQTRYDFELGVQNPFAAFSSLNVRFGANDYEHQEIEPNGEVATEFSNEAWELRSELVYDRGDWSGALGFQHTDREFSAIGEEAFIAPVDSKDTGLFWVAQREFAEFDLETGLRIGRVEHSPSVGRAEDFSTYAASIGFVVPFSDELRLGVIGDYSARAPVGEELYSDGPHLATQSFEIGNPDLDEERAANVSATLSYTGDGWSASATAYYTQFSDFIYQQATGDEEDELPVFVYTQEDADFAGLDLEASATVHEWEGGTLALRGMLDVVRAEVDVSGNDNLPRIPPLRFGLGIEASIASLTASLDFYRVAEQDDVADLELPTNAYNDVRAYVSYDVAVPEGTLTFFLAGKNLTDDEQRHHASFIKEFAPAPGRTVEAGLRWRF